MAKKNQLNQYVTEALRQVEPLENESFDAYNKRLDSIRRDVALKVSNDRKNGVYVDDYHGYIDNCITTAIANHNMGHDYNVKAGEKLDPYGIYESRPKIKSNARFYGMVDDGSEKYANHGFEKIGSFKGRNVKGEEPKAGDNVVWKRDYDSYPYHMTTVIENKEKDKPIRQNYAPGDGTLRYTKNSILKYSNQGDYFRGTHTPSEEKNRQVFYDNTMGARNAVRQTSRMNKEYIDKIFSMPQIPQGELRASNKNNQLTPEKDYKKRWIDKIFSQKQ